MRSEATPGNYRIGKVSRLTGISPDTLRIWERRYEAVTPQRSESGGRLYSAEDIARLKLMKRLVDAGDAISAVAGMSRDELDHRIAETRAAVAPVAADSPCRVVVVGEPLVSKMQNAKERLAKLELTGHYPGTRALLDDPGAAAMKNDVIVIEQPTLQVDTAREIVDMINRTGAAHAVVVYRFASQHALDLLPRSRCSALRAPVEPVTLEAHCAAITGRQPLRDSEYSIDDVETREPAPPRLYDDEKLAKIAAMSPTIKCECPHHLAELIAGLCAFEQYSSECESRNREDVELHEYLGRTASTARQMIEIALTRVIEAENIEL